MAIRKDIGVEILNKLIVIDKRLEGMDQRFDSMDQRFDRMDQRFDGMDPRFEGIESRSDKMDEKTDKIEFKFDLAVRELNSRLDGFHETLIGFRNDSFEHFDKIYRKLDFYNDEYYATNAGIRRIEEDHRIIDHKTILSRLEKLESKN